MRLRRAKFVLNFDEILPNFDEPQIWPKPSARSRAPEEQMQSARRANAAWRAVSCDAERPKRTAELLAIDDAVAVEVPILVEETRDVMALLPD